MQYNEGVCCCLLGEEGGERSREEGGERSREEWVREKSQGGSKGRVGSDEGK